MNSKKQSYKFNTYANGSVAAKHEGRRHEKLQLHNPNSLHGAVVLCHPVSYVQGGTPLIIVVVHFLARAEKKPNRSFCAAFLMITCPFKCVKIKLNTAVQILSVD